MIEAGKHVFVHYKGTLADGTVFDSSDGRDPLEFTVGTMQVIPGFEAAVVNLAVGETVIVNIPCADAYGEYSENMIQSTPTSQIPNADQLPIGQMIYFQGPQGQPLPAKVLKVEDDIAYFDFNHELAGKDLTFELTLVQIGE